MNFDFILCKLNAEISDFKGNVEYISSDNGVELYRAKEGFISHHLSFPVIRINLYFFEGNLITAYIHLGENPDSIEQFSKVLEHAIKSQGRALKLSYRKGYVWKAESSILALIQDMRKGKLYLYYSVKKFAVL